MPTCSCGDDYDSFDESDVCPQCGRMRRKRKVPYSPFLILFSVLNALLVILGAGLAAAAFYTSTLDGEGEKMEEIEDLRTYEYVYHIKRLMWSVGFLGIFAALTGIVGLVAINPRVGNTPQRMIYEIMLLITATLLLILGILILVAIFIRAYVVDDFFRPQMMAYQCEDNPNPFRALHRYQAEFNCCGLSTPPNPYLHLHGVVPWSCCTNFTSKVLKDPTAVQQLIDIAKKDNCSGNVAGTHDIYCDLVYPALRFWAFQTAIEALAIAIYCIILMIMSCVSRRNEWTRI